MNSVIEQRHLPVTWALVGLSAAAAIHWPQPHAPHLVSGLARPSHSQFAESIKPAGQTANFAAEVAEVYAVLLRKQQPLGAEFEAIWDANRDRLYES